jgi:hypothetical protein
MGMVQTVMVVMATVMGMVTVVTVVMDNENIQTIL